MVSFWALGDLRTKSPPWNFGSKRSSDFFSHGYCPLFIPPSHVYALVQPYDTLVITNSMIPLKPFLDPKFDVETYSEVKSR